MNPDVTLRQVAESDTSTKVVQARQDSSGRTEAVTVTQKVIIADVADTTSVVITAGDQVKDTGALQAEVPVEVLEAVGSDCVIVFTTYETLDSAMGQANQSQTGPDDPATSTAQLAAPPVSLKIFGVDGDELKPFTGGGGAGTFPAGVRITVLANRTGNEDCAWFDEVSKQWLTIGLRSEDGPGGSLVCVTHHLTLFGGIKRQAALAIICANWHFMESDGLQKLTEKADWLYGATAIALEIICILQLLAFVIGILLDHRARRLGNWSEEMYCNATKHKQAKPNFVGWVAAILLGGDDLADFQAFSKNLVYVNIRYVIAFDLWVHPLDVKEVMSFTGRPGHQQPHTFENVPIIESIKVHSKQAFHKFYHEMSYFQQLFTIFRSLHPFSVATQQSYSMRRTIRLLGITMHWLISLAVMALFYAGAGAAPAEDAPPECAEFNQLRDIMIGMISSLLTAPPVFLLRYLHKRKFHFKEGGYDQDAKERLGRSLRREDRILISIALLISWGCAFFLCAFLANTTHEAQKEMITGLLAKFVYAYLILPSLLAFVYVSAAAHAVKKDLNLYAAARTRYDDEIHGASECVFQYYKANFGSWGKATC